MQIELLDTFLDLVKTRSFHRTAEHLGVTQSTVSARLQALETAVGSRLFTRSRAGTELTTEGLKFESHARGLRHAWTEAQRMVAGAGTMAVNLRIGIQHDLADRGGQIGPWVAAFRKALPDCGFYIEPDYSAQMCADIARGTLDFGVVYTPQPHPDLHFATLGEVSYRLISSTRIHRNDIQPESYIRAAYSPAFDAAHAAMFPHLAGAPLASGQNAAVVGLLSSMGGAAFVLEDSAEALIANAGFVGVRRVGAITQPVYGVVHLRHRTSGMHKRLIQIVKDQITARKPADPQTHPPDLPL